MKKVLVINGSPHKKGHTTALVEEVLKEVEKEAEVRFINCYEADIKPCIDCKYCSKVKGECFIKDDMNSLYKSLKESEIIILAAPMYFGMFPSEVKALIDRCQVIWSEKHVFKSENIPLKRGIFIFNGGDQWPNMFQSMETIGRYFFNTLNCSIDYELLISNTDKDIAYVNSNLHHITGCKEALKNLF